MREHIYEGDTDILKYRVFDKRSRGKRRYLNLSEFTNIEVQFNYEDEYNSVKKTMLDGGVEVIDDEIIAIHLKQEDTFKLDYGETDIQIRLYKNNKCKATDHGKIHVGMTNSRKVIHD